MKYLNNYIKINNNKLFLKLDDDNITNSISNSISTNQKHLENPKTDKI